MDKEEFVKEIKSIREELEKMTESGLKVTYQRAYIKTLISKLILIEGKINAIIKSIRETFKN